MKKRGGKFRGQASFVDIHEVATFMGVSSTEFLKVPAPSVHETPKCQVCPRNLCGFLSDVPRLRNQLLTSAPAGDDALGKPFRPQVGMIGDDDLHTGRHLDGCIKDQLEEA